MGSLTSDVCVCPICGWTDGTFCPAAPHGILHGCTLELRGCILPEHLDLQQNAPVRISGCCPSHALLNVARTCLQTPLVPEAEVWDGQAGGASQEWGWQRSLVPGVSQHWSAACTWCFIY